MWGQNWRIQWWLFPFFSEIHFYLTKYSVLWSTADIIKLVVLLIILQLHLESNVDHDLVNNLKIGFKIELEILLLLKKKGNRSALFFSICFQSWWVQSFLSWPLQIDKPCHYVNLSLSSSYFVLHQIVVIDLFCDLKSLFQQLCCNLLLRRNVLSLLVST